MLLVNIFSIFIQKRLAVTVKVVPLHSLSGSKAFLGLCGLGV